jgi:hypothetical protein
MKGLFAGALILGLYALIWALRSIERATPPPSVKPIEVVLPDRWRYMPAVDEDPAGPCITTGVYEYSKSSKRVFRCDERGQWEALPLAQ